MKKTSLVLAALMLAACAPSIPSTATSTPIPSTATSTPIPSTATSTPIPSTATSTPIPSTATHTPIPPATATKSPVGQGNGCPVATADMALLMNEENGYCLLHPAAYAVNLPRLIIINPINAPGDVPGDAWVNITVEPASGRTAAQAADAQITEAGEGFNITRSEIVVDGTQAIVVDGLPGPDSWRKVFAVANDRLYTMEFQPWFPSHDPSQPTPLENLYTTIIDTIHFLP